MLVHETVGRPVVLTYRDYCALPNDGKRYEVLEGTLHVSQAEADRGGRAKDYNVTTLTDLAGRVLERVFTTEYGQPIIQSASYFGDYDADGDVDATDDGFLGSGQTCWGTATGTCRVFDFNQDGTLDAADETIMTALVSAPTTNRVHHNRRSSPAGNLFLHQGLVYDAEIGAYQNRAREYDPITERFMQRDPLVSDVAILSSARNLRLQNAYEYVDRAPLTYLDPSGMYALMLCTGYNIGCRCFTGPVVCCYASDACFAYLCRIIDCQAGRFPMLCGDGHLACPAPYDRWPTNKEKPTKGDTFCIQSCMAWLCGDHSECGPPQNRYDICADYCSPPPPTPETVCSPSLAPLPDF